MALIPHPQVVCRKMRVPSFYREPLGLPLRWQDDVSGELPAAVRAFTDYQCWVLAPELRLPPVPPPTPDQWTLLVDWLIHFICAPCWSENARRSVEAGDEDLANQLIQLRLDLVEDRVTTPAELDAWLSRCVDLGIDPF